MVKVRAPEDKPRLFELHGGPFDGSSFHCFTLHKQPETIVLRVGDEQHAYSFGDLNTPGCDAYSYDGPKQ